METLKLNTEQFKRLFENKHVLLNTEKVLDFYENDLVYHDGYDVYKLKSVSLDFEPKKISDKFYQEFVDLLCDHLNISPQDVVLSHYSPGERIYDVKIGDCVKSIIVLGKREAESNARSLIFDGENIEITKKQLGLYKQLGDSSYYFRWLDRDLV